MTTIPQLKPTPQLTVTNLEFADEVRRDRLNIIWQVTLWMSVFFVWIGFMRRNTNGTDIAVVSGIVLVGSFLAGKILKRGHYVTATWTLMLSITIAITYPMSTGNTNAILIVPLVYPFIIFIVGLMLRPHHTFTMLAITCALTFTVPYATLGTLSYITVYPFMAVAIAILAALVSAQVTGELYQITGWALENYSRERRTSLDLFDKRQQLEKSLLRSEVLGEKLQEINEELATAKHFRGQFLANMSHELRTPLNAIIGFSETMLSFPMMYDDVELPEAYRRDLEQIQGSGKQLLTVINDILDLSKVDAGKLEIRRECVSLDPVIDNAMMTAAGLVAKKPVELVRDVPDRLPDVYADEARLRQVIVNLYSNAAKFTDDGTITIRIRDEAPDGVRISLTDTGVGIPEDNLESIFDEFTQTENTGRDPRAGAGLGLTISQRLMGLMGGRITVESEVGVGSTFHITVPRYKPGEHAPATQPSRRKESV